MKYRPNQMTRLANFRSVKTAAKTCKTKILFYKERKQERFLFLILWIYFIEILFFTIGKFTVLVFFFLVFLILVAIAHFGNFCFIEIDSVLYLWFCCFSGFCSLLLTFNLAGPVCWIWTWRAFVPSIAGAGGHLTERTPSEERLDVTSSTLNPFGSS